MAKARNILIGLGFALALSACGTTDMASRNATAAPGITLATQGRAVPAGVTAGVTAAGPQIRAAQYNVQDVRISVPRSLKVSEANVFYPMADIVWRGEARGDRHQQVAAIYAEAMAQGTAPMKSGRGVIVDVEVVRHHCLTEKTRYTVGGVHSLHFRLTVTDAQTGAVLDGPRNVVADVKAAGGNLAIAEEQMGRTQRVVVVERLAQVIRRELSKPVAPSAEQVAQMSSDVTVSLASMGQ